MTIKFEKEEIVTRKSALGDMTHIGKIELFRLGDKKHHRLLIPVCDGYRPFSAKDLQDIANRLFYLDSQL